MTQVGTPGSLANDIAVPQDNEDTISSLSWAPRADFLASASWDGKVRIYDVSSDGRARGVAVLKAGGPVLGCDWSHCGNIVIAGGADAQIHLLHLPTSEQVTLGSSRAHEAPVRAVRLVDIPSTNGSIIASGSWDKTVKYWDMRTGGKAVATLNCGERVYAMDSKKELLVVATADNKVHTVDLREPTKFLRSLDVGAHPRYGQFRHQIKALACFPDGKGWAAGSIDGRVAVGCVDKPDEDDAKHNFSFKCHRENTTKTNNNRTTTTKIYSINDISFHPAQQTTFSTAASDGRFHFWDRAAKHRVRTFPPVVVVDDNEKKGVGITATAFNGDGRFFSYAVGYDWNRGWVGNNSRLETGVMVHLVEGEDVVLPKQRKMVGFRLGGEVDDD